MRAATRTTIEEALEDFATHGLTNRRRASENTRRSYLLDIRQWINWLHTTGFISYVDEIVSETVTHYHVHLEDCKLKLSSRHY